MDCGLWCIENTKTDDWGLRSIENRKLRGVEWGEGKKMRILVWGPFQPTELVLENGFENWIFWLFSNAMFLESWGQPLFRSTKIFQIRGRLRSWEVVKGQISKLTETRHVIHFWKHETKTKMFSLNYLSKIILPLAPPETSILKEKKGNFLESASHITTLSTSRGTWGTFLKAP